MHHKVLIASSLFAVIALSNCIVHPKPAPKYSRDFTFPTEASPTRELPIWQWPFLGANNNEAAHRVRRQATISSDDQQLARCSEYLAHGAYAHPRLLFVWYNGDVVSDPVKFLRTILINDLNLPHLAFKMQRVKIEPNQMLFELTNHLQSFEVLRNYCRHFSQITEYRAQGYDDQPLSYEILQTDEDFNDES